MILECYKSYLSYVEWNFLCVLSCVVFIYRVCVVHHWGRDRMVVGFPTTYEIGAYHH
jgi:hypothetical protein